MQLASQSLAHLLDPDAVPSEDGAEVHFPSIVADAPTRRHGDGLVV